MIESRRATISSDGLGEFQRQKLIFFRRIFFISLHLNLTRVDIFQEIEIAQKASRADG